MNQPVRVTAVTLALSAALATAAAAQDHFPPAPALEDMVRYLVEDSVVPGAVLGVLEADGTTRVVAYGSAGRDGPALGPRSTFEIGSVTKTFTATVLADMARRGELSLDDPVSAYLPDSVAPPSRAGREITLRHLATHTSGLPRQGHLAADIYDPYADFTLETLYAFLDTVELRDIPGTRYRYSNVGMNVLSHALERAAGRPYARLLRERVLEPLGLDRTTYSPEGAVAASLVRPHDDRGAIGYRTLPAVTRGQGGLFSSAEDLLAWLRAQVAPPDTGLARTLRATRQLQLASDRRAEGLAWHISIFGSDTILWHDGATGGTTTMVAFEPRQRLGAVLLANVGGLSDDLPMALVAQDPPPPTWEPVPADPARFRRYTGTYQADDSDTRSFVRLQPDGHLTYQPAGNARARLYATSDSTFYLLRGPWTLTFRPDSSTGGVTLHMRVDERAPESDLEVQARKVADQTPGPVAAAGGPWYRPARGPGPWGLLALAALVLGALWLGPIRTRSRTRPR